MIVLPVSVSDRMALYTEVIELIQAPRRTSFFG